MLQTEILESLQQLPDSLQQEVLHYIEFLKTRYAQPKAETPKKRRAAGALKGKIIMADDFDAPLEDFKEYM
ncbi:type II toxin-antitoxin system VapB family antitoxin [Phormidesmis priestleyi]